MVAHNLHFADITILKKLALIHKRREVAHNVVDRDGARESNTTLEVLALLAGEGLLDFLLNHFINSAADSGDIGSDNTELAGLGKAR